MEREMNEEESHKDKAEKEKETLSLKEIKIKERGHVQHDKFREMQGLENLMEGESEHREAGEKKKKRKLKEQKTTEPTPLLEEVKPQTQVSPPVRSSLLKPIEAELSMLPSVSENFALPATRFKPLPPVTKPPMHSQKPAPAPVEVILPGTPLQVDPPKPLVVPPHPTPAPDELFSLRGSKVSPPTRLVVPLSPTPVPDEVVALQCSSDEVCPPSLLKPQPATVFLFEPPPQIMLIDIEDEENEYVEYTGKTIWGCDLLKSERLRLLEAEINPRKPAWLESDSEVLEEVWASEVVEVLGFKEEKDSKAIEGHLDEASQKKKEMDDDMMKLFCVTSPKGPKNETQHYVNVQKEPKRKKKVPLVLFIWAEDKAKKKEGKNIRKEKERRDKELLLERYRNDPKLKHLLINKHNRHHCSSE
ncbi:stress response NST1-like isoform X1 [Labeo rohita]|uniref:Stress response NST1-like isoform X1 n=1 Tax=Labeo rohita TaxID=84645 RepID=A0A498M8X6_LABRO|nr:stress response NST1-like isoform X1 [Labeo rohita]